MDIEAEKELDYLNNELHMRIEKEYSNGAVLISFSLIYFATIIGILVNLVESSLSLRLIKILLFGAISGISFFAPILLYYSTATRNRENLSALLNVASYKKKYFENYAISNSGLSGGKWENFHKITLYNFFNKGENEVFFLAGLSFLLFAGCFLVTVYLAVIYIKAADFSFYWIFLVCEVLMYIVCFFYSIERIIKLHGLYSLTNVSAEIESTEIYYDVQIKLLNKCKKQDELSKIIADLKYENGKFSEFLVINRIPLHKAILLERLFYSQAFKEIEVELPDERKLTEDKIIKYVSGLSEKSGLSIYEYISNFNKNSN